MKKTFRAFLLIAVGIGSIAAAEPRQPTGRWVVDYDDAQCVASRNYGTDERPLFLALKPSPTGSVMRVMLMRNGGSRDAEQRAASVRLDDGTPLTTNALVFGDRETKRLVTSINLPISTLAANRKAASIEIKAGFISERLQVPGLIGVMAAFDDCLANLRKIWNVGEPHSKAVAQPARSKKPLSNLFPAAMYPRQALRENDSGKVGIALLVDETGKIRDCMVEETSGFATLDTMSCSVITRSAQFEPATGAEGKPVKSAFFQRISWRIRP